MRLCVTHPRCLVGTAHREVPSPLRASCCSSTWPWWCLKLWGRSIFLRRIWWSRSSLWCLPEEKKEIHFCSFGFTKTNYTAFVRGEKKSDYHINTVCCVLLLTNGFSHHSSAACSQRARSPAGRCTGSCRGCWCRCQTGRCWAPPHTRWYLGGECKRCQEGETSRWFGCPPTIWVYVEHLACA